MKAYILLALLINIFVLPPLFDSDFDDHLRKRNKGLTNNVLQMISDTLQVKLGLEHRVSIWDHRRFIDIEAEFERILVVPKNKRAEDSIKSKTDQTVKIIHDFKKDSTIMKQIYLRVSRFEEGGRRDSLIYEKH